METLKLHPFAKFFPPLEGEEFDALVQDIKENGLREPIVLAEGAILDGRNRYRACLKAHVKPAFEKYQGNGDALAFVISKNIMRRHLTETQRALIAEEHLLPLQKKLAAERAAASLQKATAARRASGRTTAGAETVGASRMRRGHDDGSAHEIAGRMVKVSGRTVQRVEKVRQLAPDLIEEMRQGKLSAREAEHQVRLRQAGAAVKRVQERAEAKKRNEDPREVKTFLDALSTYRKAVYAWQDAIETGIKVMEYGKFSPEAKRFVRTKLAELRAQEARIAKSYVKLEETSNAK